MTVPNASIYRARRQAVAKQLGAQDLALIPTAPARTRNRDADYPYRHDSYFYYLSGFTEPDAWLAIQPNGHTTLFCQPKDLEREIWDGYRLGPEAACQALGVDAAFSVADLDQHMPELLGNRRQVWWPFATHDGLHARIEAWLRLVRGKARQGVTAPDGQRDVCAVLDEMRLIKDGHELSIMRRAGEISAHAHIRCMQRSAHMLRCGEDAREYHLDAELLHAFRAHGAEGPAYTSIVAAGANACVLHYRAGNSALRAGELVLIDAACELEGYASDITRTFPANGRFTGAQRAVYEVVLAAQEAAIAETKAGARFDTPHEAAVRVLVQGMLDLKLLNADHVGTVDDAIASKSYTRFYMHRTGHWLGMDVHDCGNYIDTNQPQDQGTPLSRVLQPGMVLTIEPGLYIRPSDDVPERFHNIGIRIEDDATVTASGCELLTRGVPVDIQSIEALMAE